MTVGQESSNGSEGAAGRTPGNTSRPRDDARRVKEKAGEAAREVTQRGKQRLETRKSAAADQVEQLASAVDTAAGELRDQDNTLAHYAGELASGMDRFAENLRTRSIDELAGDVQALARRNPTAFLLGSVALGVALSRFLKASTEHSRESASGEEPAQRFSSGYDSTAAESQGPGTPLAEVYTAPSGMADAPLHPGPAGGVSGAGLGMQHKET